MSWSERGENDRNGRDGQDKDEARWWVGRRLENGYR